MSSSNQISPSGWEPPSVEHLQQMLPQYEISQIIGRGGMGAVYRGRQPKLDREVAIKLLPESFSEKETAEEEGGVTFNFVKRFEQEARAMAKLDHPAIVSVFDFGETEEGQLYFVMEFIDGMDIHQYIRENGGKIPPDQALAVTAHVLDALDYAHSHGIIHRDIKPANILLNREGRVKIADFGLAKRFSEESDQTTPALTVSNVAVGTPDYLAPEALEHGRIPDHRADLYSVGVMLYQMLTGTVPRGQFKLPSAFIPDLDPRIDEIVSQSLQTDPDDRYDSASSIRSAIDPIFSTPITKVEGKEIDEESGERVTSSNPSSGPPSLPGPKPAEVSKIPIFIGVGLAVLLLSWGATTMVMKNTGSDGPVLEKAPAPGPVVAKAQESDSPAQKPAAPTVATGGVSMDSEKNTGPAPSEKSNQPAGKSDKPPVTDNDPIAEKKPEKPEPAEPESTPTIKKENPKPVELVMAAKPPPVDTPKEKKPKNLHDDLAAVPGLKLRLQGYLSARKTEVGKLSESYLRGLDTRLNQAADAGDLKTVKAFREEKARVSQLKESMAQPMPDLFEAVANSTTLPELSSDSPESLEKIRETWTSERKKIRNKLDGQLKQSLKALESQLTRKREFETAETVLVYRENLFAPAVSSKVAASVETKPVAPSDPKDEKPSSEKLANPFDWKPIGENPFPLTRPKRPTTPCRVTAFRFDGKPVNEAEFRKLFGGVPADMGEIVDMDCKIGIEDPIQTGRPLGLREDGTVVGMKNFDFLKKNAALLTDVVQIVADANVGAALTGSGKVIPLRLAEKPLENDKVEISEATAWNDIVQIAAGNSHLIALTADGIPKVTGLNKSGQASIPTDFENGIAWIQARADASLLGKLDGDDLILRILGAKEETQRFSRKGQVLSCYPLTVSNSEGEVVFTSLEDGEALHHRQIRGRRLKEMRDVIASNHSKGSAGAYRQNSDEWRFVGEFTDFSDREDLDIDYCEKRANGAWKLFFLREYCLALKPVANLTHDDWTGEASVEPNKTTSAETTPTSKATDRNGADETQFPLSVPKRPEIPGKLIAFRLDGEAVDETELQQVLLGSLPEYSDIVAIATPSQKVDSNANGVQLYGLRSNGSLFSAHEKVSSRLPEEPVDAISIAPITGAVAVLNSEGKVRIFGGEKESKLIESAVGWPKMAALASSPGNLWGIDTEGSLHAAGREYPKGEAEIFPKKPENRYLRLPKKPYSTHFVALDEGGQMVSNRDDSILNDWKLPSGERLLFLSNRLIFTWHESRGLLYPFSKGHLADPNHYRGRLKDIDHLVVADLDQENCLVAARNLNREWHWWGELNDRRAFDPDYCEEMSKDCIDLKIFRPIVIGLKATAP